MVVSRVFCLVRGQAPVMVKENVGAMRNLLPRPLLAGWGEKVGLVLGRRAEAGLTSCGEQTSLRPARGC